MFQNLRKAQHTLIAGIILGGIFGISTGVSFVRGWDLVMIFGTPLALRELLGLLNDCMPFVVVGFGFGSVAGALYSSFITRSKVVIVGSLLALAALFFIVDIALVLLIFFPYFVEGVGPAIVIGFGILLIYLKQKDLKILVPLVILGGFFAAYIPWKLNGEIVYVDMMQRTSRYAVESRLSNYHVEYWGRNVSSSDTAIYLADGALLRCKPDVVNNISTVACEWLEQSK